MAIPKAQEGGPIMVAMADGSGKRVRQSRGVRQFKFECFLKFISLPIFYY